MKSFLKRNWYSIGLWSTATVIDIYRGWTHAPVNLGGWYSLAFLILVLGLCFIVFNERIHNLQIQLAETKQKLRDARAERRSRNNFGS
jgi:hypothetical protein